MTPDPFQRRLAEIADESAALDIRSYEACATPDLVAGLVPSALRIVQKAADLCSQIVTAYEPEEEKAPADEGTDEMDLLSFDLACDASDEKTFGRQLDTLLDGGDAGGDPRQHVAEVAFMARWELRQKIEALRTTTAGEEAWEVISRCSSGLRRVRKTAAAIERALCEAEGLTPCLHYRTELSIALAVRRCYGRFLRGLQEAGTADEESVARVLRSVSSCIAKLIGLDEYSEFRITDRIHIRQLQQRVLDWARLKEDARTGIRLWQDVNAFARLLGQINQRQELIAHDRQRVEEAFTALVADSRRDAFVTEESVAPFRVLEGLDPALDALLASPKGTLAVEWMVPLQRLRARLSGARNNAGYPAPEEPPPTLYQTASPSMTKH